MVGPAHRRAAAHAVVTRGRCSGRAACRILRLSRATFWYRAQPPTLAQERLAKRLRVLSEAHPRYGYRRIAALLRQEGWAVGKRHIQRLRRADGLRVPPTKRRLVRQGASTGLPTKATRRGHVWTWDFVSDATVRGGALKMLTILDEHTRERHVLRPDRAMRAADVLTWLWSEPSTLTAHRLTCGATTGRSSSPRRCNAGWRPTRSKPSASTRAAPGRTASWRASMAAFGTSASTREQLWTLTEARVVVADLPSALQPLSPARQTRLPEPDPLCRPTSTLHPGFSRGSWTNQTNLTTHQPAPGLTLSLPGSEKRVSSTQYETRREASCQKTAKNCQLYPHFYGINQQE